MDSLQITPAVTELDIRSIADLADVIWNEHFISILSQEQIDYMVAKFQSYEAIKAQITDGYEYFKLQQQGVLAGYVGICVKDNSLFLSKLYIHNDFRGQKISSKAFHYLTELCTVRGLKRIWLTCNKYNTRTLDIYKHFNFHVVDTQEADIGGGFIMDDYIMEYEA